MIVATTTVVFVALAMMSRVPDISVNWTAAGILSATLLMFLVLCGAALWKSTRFN
jgi:hypothetical protein